MTTLLFKRIWMGGLLCCAFGLHSAWAIAGCGNQNLQGTYNLQIDNASLIDMLTAINTNISSQTAPGDLTGPGRVPPNFPGSLTFTSFYAGRYYFDGNGSIVGMINGDPTNVTDRLVRAVVGTYSVDTSCNAAITLMGGRTFTAVLASQGQTGMFMETDSAGSGATGTLSRSANMCADSASPQSLAFRYSGAASIPASDKYQPYSSLGSLSLDGAGNFTMTTTTFSGGAIRRTTASGAYAIQSDCGLQLTFAAPPPTTGGATTGAFEPTPNFSGLLSGMSAGGSISVVQPLTGLNLTGQIVVQ